MSLPGNHGLLRSGAGARSTMILDASTSALMSLALSYLPVAATPGPNFLIVSRAGLAASRLAALRAAAGVALGAASLAALAASGAHLLPRGHIVSLAAELVFGLLLLHFAIRALLRAWRDAAGEADALLDHRHFRCGFLAAVSNPFTAAFLATAARGDLGGAEAGGTVFLVALAWFGLVGCVFCHPWLRTLYARWRGRAEEVLGFVLLAMAVKALLRLASHAAGG